MSLFGTIVYAANEAANGAANAAGAANGTAGAAANTAVSPVMQGIVSFLPLIAIIAVMYFLLIRPQRKREKETRAMINALKVGDKVTTIGGIVGKIARIKDNTVIIETGNVGTPDEKSYIKMERDSIKSVEKKLSN